MVTKKTEKEIELMKISGKIASGALAKVLENVKPGVNCRDLDSIAYNQITKAGAKPSFMTVDDYKWTICTTVNNEVVHGIPTQILEEGDILGIDIGAIYEGYHSDLAISVPVGEISTENKKFLDVGKKALELAKKEAKNGNKIGDISSVIQKNIENAGYSVVKNLTGHGVGRELHEDPMIPCFGKAGVGPKITSGMTLAIEVIYAKGKGDVVLESDNWTISTKDGSLGGLFEQTLAVTESDPIILTPYL